MFGLAKSLLAKLGNLSKSWMASDPGEAKVIAKNSQKTHQEILFQVDYVSLLIGTIVMLIGIALMVARIQESPAEQFGSSAYARTFRLLSS